MKDLYHIAATAQPLPENCVQAGNVRVTVLAPALVRVEWSAARAFTDAPTQKVWHREFPAVRFSRQEEGGALLLETERLLVRCTPAPSLRESVDIRLKAPVDGLHKGWRYGDAVETLKGTARTLDNADGAIPLEDGILSRYGFAVLDDSASYLVAPDGTLAARADAAALDVYFFGYGHAYRECLRDFLRLTGMPPLLPRWAMGNWWSRYHAYTQQEYLELMDRFAQEGIPLSVAMIDMDWHVTKIDPAVGSGWTGYSWNRDLIPDPPGFLAALHERRLKTSLNVHPAEGVGRHEDAYPAMRQALGLPDDGEAVPFDIASPAFVEAYFEYLHAPLERQGVDFWWVDWQQGDKTARPGLDPLWVLNHYHYLDNAKDGRRPLILSRYAGPGSHRYPIGFSGDSVISWKSLAFQPYFTATASNIGYGWWSHDIGGHMLGSYDEELQVRWVQFGVFSPIMRLHSSASEFNHKEPWKLGATEAAVVRRYLRLRHRLIPYLYTLNVLFSREGRPPLQPMYYEFPEEPEAYAVPNEYYFGTELICAPVTVPLLPHLQMAPVPVWLPPGLYTDVFTGITYAGGRSLTLYRSLADVPLLLRAGGIVPLAPEGAVEDAAVALPAVLDVYAACGADGTFTLYEDDGESLAYREGRYVRTAFSLECPPGGPVAFAVRQAEGDRSLLPQERTYRLHLLNCERPAAVLVACGGSSAPVGWSYNASRREVVTSVTAPASEALSVTLERAAADAQDAAAVARERCFALLDKARLEFLKKEELFGIIQGHSNPLDVCEWLLSRNEDSSLIGALLERLQNK